MGKGGRSSESLIAQVAEWEQKQEEARQLVLQEKAERKAHIKAQVSEWQAKQSSPTTTATAPPSLPISHAQRAAAAAAAAKEAEAAEAMMQGHQANERGEFEVACQHFKRAQSLTHRVSARVSAANMSLKLGEAAFAVSEYEALLANEHEAMSPKVQASVVAKLDEARRQQEEVQVTPMRALVTANGLDQWQKEALAQRSTQSSKLVTMWPLLLVLALIFQHVIALLRSPSESVFFRLARFGLM